MKILHVVAYPPDHIGGLMIYVNNIVKYETLCGVTCEVLTSDLSNPKSFQIRKDGVTYNYIKNYGELWGSNPVFNIVPFLLRRLKEFDLVHVHSYIHFSSLQAIVIAKLMHIPSILTLHGGVNTSIANQTTIADKMKMLFKNIIFDRIFGGIVVKSANAVISVSKNDLKLINRVFHISRTAQNFWIPNGINSNFLEPHRNNAKKRKYISFISPRLTTVKGVDIFLRLMEIVNQQIKNIPILIIGAGKMGNLVMKYKKKLNIKYIPQIPHDRIIDYYLASKMFVCTSRTEGLPTVLLEAMATHVPVLSTNVGGVPELITHGSNGFLFDPNDIDTGANLLLMLLKDKELQTQFIQRSRAKVEQVFSWDQIVKKNLQVYTKVLANF